MPDYPPGGTLFTNDRKTSDKQPDYSGTLEFDEATVRSLMDQLRAGDVPKCDLSGWKKTSRSSGKTFLSLAAKPPRKKDGASSDRGGSRPPPPRRRDDDDLPF